MKVRCFLKGFAVGRAKLTKAQKTFHEQVAASLEQFGKDFLKEFRRRATGGEFGPGKVLDPTNDPRLGGLLFVKKNRDSKGRFQKGGSTASMIPLIETGGYINSWKSRVTKGGKGSTLVIAATGTNLRGIPYEDLADILEYGRRAVGRIYGVGPKAGPSPPRPHMRPMALWAEQFVNAGVGARVFRAILERG